MGSYFSRGSREVFIYVFLYSGQKLRNCHFREDRLDKMFEFVTKQPLEESPFAAKPKSQALDLWERKPEAPQRGSKSFRR